MSSSFPGIPKGGLYGISHYVVDRGSWWCSPRQLQQQSFLLRWMELLQKVECHAARTRPSSQAPRMSCAPVQQCFEFSEVH